MPSPRTRHLPVALFVRLAIGLVLAASGLALVATGLVSCSGGGDGGQGALDQFFNRATFRGGVPVDLSACPAPPTDATTACTFPGLQEAKLEVSDTTNGTITFALSVKGVPDLFNVYFDLVYNPAVLLYQSSALDPSFGSSGNATIQAAVNAPGRLVVGATRLTPNGGVTPTGAILRLTFAIQAKGVTCIRFDPGQNLGGDDSSMIRVLLPQNFCGGVLRID